MRRGVGHDGSAVYPAMPFPSYAKVSDADTQALYAYFMQGVEPVKQANKANDIPWPLSIRGPLAYWRTGARCSRLRRSQRRPLPAPMRRSLEVLIWRKAWATVALATPLGR